MTLTQLAQKHNIDPESAKALPRDVRSLWWSGRFWYASSVESKERGRNAGDPKYQGVGMTKHNAIWDMRNQKRKELIARPTDLGE